MRQYVKKLKTFGINPKTKIISRVSEFIRVTKSSNRFSVKIAWRDEKGNNEHEIRNDKGRRAGGKKEQDRNLEWDKAND